MKNILYVVWDAPESRYLEGLFLPIFAGLEDHGYKFHVLRFTWRNEDGSGKFKTDTAQACRARGIAYREVLTLRRPGGIGPFMSALAGGSAVDAAVADWSIDCVMPRAIMGSIPVLHSRAGRSNALVFDADGLAADERVDFSGLSRSSLVYRLLKRYERRMLQRAGSVIARSQGGIDIYRGIVNKDPDTFFESTNGRDPGVFYPRTQEQNLAVRKAMGIAGEAPLIVHNGSFGQKYMPNLELDIFQRMAERDASAVFLILTNAPQVARTYVVSHFGEVPPNIIVREVSFTDVPDILSACDVGICLIKETLSTKAVMPTKLGEFLLSGVGVLGTDVCIEAALFDRPFAYRVDPASAQEPDEAALWALNYTRHRQGLAHRARAHAEEHYGVSNSIASYADALNCAFDRQRS